jgi:DNA/RNA endonuclease G (NUC1)
MRQSLRALMAACLTVLATQACAETDAQWQPNAANKISTCRALWIALGDVPTHGDAVNRDTTIVCHSKFLAAGNDAKAVSNGFVLSHDNVSKTPDWVLERLTKAGVSGPQPRPEKSFVMERRVPPRGRARGTDYPPKTSNFARGHMAPSEDFNTSANAMKDTFVLSNAVPQIGPRFNGSVWGSLEDEARLAAKARDVVHVISGPVRASGAERTVTIAQSANRCDKRIVLDGPAVTNFCAEDGKGAPCERGGVGVPVGLFKIIYDARSGDAYAFVLPNRDHDRGGTEIRPYLETFRVSVDAIESVTGLRFFAELPADKRRQAREQCAPGTLWP